MKWNKLYNSCLTNLQNTYGDNLYAPVAPNAVQDTLNIETQESEFDPLYDGDVDIEESAVDNNATIKRSLLRNMEISKLPSLMIQTTTFCLGEE